MSDLPATDTAADSLQIEVAYAEPEQQYLVALEMAPGSTLWDAVQASGLLQQCAALQQRDDEIAENVGIFGSLKPADTPLSNGDRVEIYRPLLMDPKEARRLRAAKANSQ